MKPTIYAIDFDGTLCENKWPSIGRPNIKLIKFLQSEQEKGNKLILYTMREGEMLKQAVRWCKVHGLKFNAVNDNEEGLKEAFGNNPRKIYADVYIDDHNAKYGVCTDLPFARGQEAQ